MRVSTLQTQVCPRSLQKAKKKTPEGVYFGNTGNDLGFRLVSKQVCSALEVFTSVFGMRTGVAPLLKSPVMVE